MRTFGEFMRARRVENRVSLATVADELEFTAVHISEVERGNRNPPSPNKVRDWAHIIGVPSHVAVKLAAQSVDVVKLPVKRDPKKAELALAFQRRMDSLSEEERNELMRILGKEGEGDD